MLNLTPPRHTPTLPTPAVFPRRGEQPRGPKAPEKAASNAWGVWGVGWKGVGSGLEPGLEGGLEGRWKAVGRPFSTVGGGIAASLVTFRLARGRSAGHALRREIIRVPTRPRPASRGFSRATLSRKPNTPPGRALRPAKIASLRSPVKGVGLICPPRACAVFVGLAIECFLIDFDGTAARLRTGDLRTP
jgi:hypothetical protein